LLNLIIANKSEPIPLHVGSTTDKQAATATAASIAFPFFFNMSKPA